MRDPERYGVVEFGADGRAISLEEKPKNPKSQFAVPGLYVYDEQVVDICRTCGPRPAANWRSLTSIAFISSGINCSCGYLAAGWPGSTPERKRALLEAGNYIATIEHRQGLKVACLEEVALRMGFIDRAQLEKIIDKLPKAEYREYLRIVCDEAAGAAF